ncbi:hypothetical protein [Salinibacter ruber]|uniref:hypothetical protein n=1 Tax=Salinibacter ruber TaxID=146919 RepID=UPI00216A0B91|nr:hypothetical protein [Salinibacter ruber]MCS4054077.1 hypothetical protein [Salinibacter ruber]
MKYSDTKGPISLSSVSEDSIGHRIPGSKKDVESAVIKVTPEMAKEWLKKNRSNRKVREDRVDRYAEQMKDGEWMVSPDAIAFSHTGKLINGQHRLKAITQLDRGESVECLVVFGLDPAAFKIADVGVKRTGADVLRIEGFKSAEEMAAVCRLLALWKQGRLEELHRYENVSNSVIVDIATACRKRLTETIEKVGSDKKALNGLMPRSLMAFAYFAYKPTFPERAEFFLNGLMFEKNYPAIDWEEAYEKGVKNPIKLLKDKMRPNYKELSRKAKLALLVKAMNRYCLERPLKQLRWRSNEDFPELAAKKPEAEQDLFS